jgi:hypothetical protein
MGAEVTVPRPAGRVLLYSDISHRAGVTAYCIALNVDGVVDFLVGEIDGTMQTSFAELHATLIGVRHAPAADFLTVYTDIDDAVPLLNGSEGFHQHGLDFVVGDIRANFSHFGQVGCYRVNPEMRHYKECHRRSRAERSRLQREYRERGVWRLTRRQVF